MQTNKWRVVKRRADGETTSEEFATRDEAMRAAEKKDQVYAPAADYPRVVYHADRTLRIVQDEAQYKALMAENKKGEKPIWGDSPMAHGIETHPAYNPATSESGRW